jgi:hypothetical protein
MLLASYVKKWIHICVFSLVIQHTTDIQKRGNSCRTVNIDRNMKIVKLQTFERFVRSDVLTALRGPHIPHSNPLGGGCSM